MLIRYEDFTMKDGFEATEIWDYYMKLNLLRVTFKMVEERRRIVEALLLEMRRKHCKALGPPSKKP